MKHYGHSQRYLYTWEGECHSKDTEQVKSLAVPHTKRMSRSHRTGLREKQLSVNSKAMA